LTRDSKPECGRNQYFKTKKNIKKVAIKNVNNK